MSKTGAEVLDASKGGGQGASFVRRPIIIPTSCVPLRSHFLESGRQDFVDGVCGYATVDQFLAKSSVTVIHKKAKR